MTRLELWGADQPHPGQLEAWNRADDILAGTLRTMFLPCGPRWGKDRLSVWLCLRTGFSLLAQRAETSLIPAVHQWVVGPTYSLMDQLWREYNTYLRGIGDINISDRRLTLPGGYVIEFRSSEREDSLDGVGLDVLHVTEAASVGDSAWNEHLSQRLMSPGRLGFACINGTPGTNPSDWYVRLWERAGYDPSVLMVNRPSWDNPHLDRRQLEAIFAEKQTTPEQAWRATYGAELVPSSGSALRRVRDAATGAPEAPKPGGVYVGFMDTAKSVDFNAISLFRVAQNRLINVYADRWNQTEWPVSLARVGRIRGYRGTLFVDCSARDYTDPIINGVASVVGPLVRVQPYKFTLSNKEQMTGNMAMLLEQGGITLLDPRKCDGPMVEAAQAQIRELERWRPEKKPSGNVTYSAPEGEHDDMAVAAMAAALLAREHAVDVGAVMSRLGGVWG